MKIHMVHPYFSNLVCIVIDQPLLLFYSFFSVLFSLILIPSELGLNLQHVLISFLHWTNVNMNMIVLNAY